MQFRIGHKIIASYGLLILLTFGLGWYQLANIQRLNDMATRALDGDIGALEVLREIGAGRREVNMLLERATGAYLLKRANVQTEDALTYVRERALVSERTKLLCRKLAAIADEHQKTAILESRAPVWGQIAAMSRTLERTLEELTVAGNAQLEVMRREDLSEFKPNHDLVQRLHNEASAQEVKITEVFDRLSTLAEQGIKDLNEDVRNKSIMALIGVLIVGVAVAFAIHRSISAPIREFTRFAEHVGGGDLTRKLDASRGDELGQLSGHFNEMVSNLNVVARQVRTASENLNTATAEMQASVQQHATSTTEQSAAVQQITTTLTEIARSGAQISDRSKVVAQTAEAASATSKAGIHSVNETNRAMGMIREQAEKVATNIVALTERTQSIGTIIATVNDLSERSNLLALNAAIEAAAAGEHGASFAVVADEIKNLANQAKEATSEVRSILSDVQHRIGTAVMQTEEAVKRVDAGRAQAAATEGTINELARSVEQSVSTFEQIVAATAQQQVGIEQVTASISNIRESSEQMAAGSREVGIAATNLAALSEQILKVVDRYRV